MPEDAGLGEHSDQELGVDAEDENERCEDEDGHRGGFGDGDGAGVLWGGLPIHGADDFEVVVEATGDGHNAHENEEVEPLIHGGFEDEKLPEEPDREWHAGEGGGSDEHGEREAGRAAGKAVEMGDIVPPREINKTSLNILESQETLSHSLSHFG